MSFVINLNNITNNLSLINVKNKSIIYVRSSTKNQNNLQTNSASLEMQIFTCKKFAEKNNIDIVSIEQEVCSARKGLNQKILHHIINNNNNIILIVFDISRFSRSIFDGTDLLKKCLDNNISLYSVKDNLIIRDMKDIQNFSNLLFNSQAESDAISNRVLESIKFRRSLGAYFGKDKYGYTIVTENNIKKLIPNKNELNVIQLILKLKYGSNLKLINDLVKTITNKKSKIELTEIVMFGNFNNRNIAYFLNQNNILNRTTVWVEKDIQKIINQNIDYINKKYDVTEQLIMELIKISHSKDNAKIVRTVNLLFLEINEYKLCEVLEYYGKKYFSISNFLNKHNVNFRVWSDSDIQSYVSDIFISNNNVEIKKINKKQKLDRTI